MGKANINELETELRDWDFLRQLPEKIDEFILQPGTGVDGQILNLAAYVNENTHCRLDFIYTSETFDYVPVKTIGLHSFRDERFFFRDKEEFAAVILKNLPVLISDISRSRKHFMGYDAAEQHFESWDYWKNLPPKINGYELFLTPANPVEYINGSTLFLDYTDFKQRNQIVFLYNSFRNEIFAETKKNGFPLTTNVFDAANLQELEGLLKLHLREELEKLEKA